MTLVVVSFICRPHGLDGLIAPSQGLAIDGLHGTALVEDEKVVDGNDVLVGDSFVVFF
jgi:hypothetical protein